MLVSYVNNENEVVKENIETYKDIFVSSEGKTVVSNVCLLLMFGRGESRWLVQNDEYYVYATGESLKESFQEFDDLLIYAYNRFKNREHLVEEFKENARLKKLYLDTFSIMEK